MSSSSEMIKHIFRRDDSTKVNYYVTILAEVNFNVFTQPDDGVDGSTWLDKFDITIWAG
jgi:hypothetical protein